MRDPTWLPEMLSDLIRKQKQEDRTILGEEMARIYERGWDKGFDKGFDQGIVTQKGKGSPTEESRKQDLYLKGYEKGYNEGFRDSTANTIRTLDAIK